MKNRKNYLKSRKRKLKWERLGLHEPSVCGRCGQKAVYYIPRYDSFCCTACNEWLDKACSDPDCPFCGGRPGTPYEMYFLADTDAGSAEGKKRWRRDHYQHKTDGGIKHDTRRKAVAERQDAGQDKRHRR